jgi:rhodanese-related sulfurtransferase
MRWMIWFVLPLVTVAALLAGWRYGGLWAIRHAVRARFSSVQQVSTQELAGWLASNQQPLLLDVRTEAEYSVSHLAGARRVAPDAMAKDVLALSPNAERKIVLYCSVGGRSSALANRLLAAGHRCVYNLDGAIFAWANEGRALESRGQHTTDVHPYNQLFALLLQPPARAQ